MTGRDTRPRRTRTEDLPGTRKGLHQVYALDVPVDEDAVRALIRRYAADETEAAELADMLGVPLHNPARSTP